MRIVKSTGASNLDEKRTKKKKQQQLETFPTDETLIATRIDPRFRCNFRKEKGENKRENFGKDDRCDASWGCYVRRDFALARMMMEEKPVSGALERVSSSPFKAGKNEEPLEVNFLGSATHCWSIGVTWMDLGRPWDPTSSLAL
ncbi:hypothetical protein ACLOJK_021478 [Asimina triloba]